MLLSLARKVGVKQDGSLLKDEVLQSGLLSKNGPNSYAFLHLRFQEYFAAAALKRRAEEELKGRRWLFAGETYSCQTCHTVLAPFSYYFWHADWHDTLTLLAGLLEDATPFLERIQAERDDAFRQMLTLAACCLGSARAVDKAVGEEIVKAVCQEWKEAVREERSFGTEALGALSKGRQEKGAEQVRAFLCAELKDEDEDVRLAAARALGELGDPGAVRPLLSAARWRQEETLWEALQMLSQRAQMRVYGDGKWKPLPPIEPSSIKVIAHAVRGRR